MGIGWVGWLSILSMIALLFLLASRMPQVFRHKNALRNAAIWIGLIAALGWGYKYAGHLLPENVQQNMDQGRMSGMKAPANWPRATVQQPAEVAPASPAVEPNIESGDSPIVHAPAPEPEPTIQPMQDDGPVRNQ